MVVLMAKFGSEVGNVRLLVALEPVRRLLALKGRHIYITLSIAYRS